VEKTPGVYDFRDSDRAVKSCMEYGLEPIYLIVATPKWALDPEDRDKPWGHAPKPEFYPEARRFYRMLAARYRGQVRYYEFWNEENGYGWHAINRPDEYAPILKVAYEALKEGNPECQVAVGGLDGAGWKGYPRYLERLYELGCKDYFDAVAVHPYRADGPIDAISLKGIHRLMESHGDGHKKLWLTEYGWSKEYGQDNKARWLKESLDLLTSAELDFVFQASIHTLGDFDAAEYGMCDGNLEPRAAYQVFRDYPKDWDRIAELQAQPVPKSLVSLENGSFEKPDLPWTPYGDGMTIRKASELGIPAEDGVNVLAAPTEDLPNNGGMLLRIALPGKVPVHLSARAFTEQSGGDARNSRCRVGIDPTGGTDATAETVIWGRARDTSGAWDTVGVGQGDPIYPSGGAVTLFLEYMQKGRNAGQISVFDEVVLDARPDTFVLPKVEPIPYEQYSQSPPLPELTPLSLPEDRLVYQMPELPPGDQDEFESNVGEWRMLAGNWIGVEGGRRQRHFLFSTCAHPLPDGDWTIGMDVFSQGDLNVGIWAGEDMDHCVLAMVDQANFPDNVYFIERNGEGIGGFRGRMNMNSVTVLQREKPRLTVTRRGDTLRLFVNGEEVTSYPEYGKPTPRFGLFLLSPRSGLFGNIHVLRD